MLMWGRSMLRPYGKSHILDMSLNPHEDRCLKPLEHVFLMFLRTWASPLPKTTLRANLGRFCAFMNAVG